MKAKILIISAFLFIGFIQTYAQSKLSIGVSSSYLRNNRVLSKSNSSLYKDYRNNNESSISGINIEANLFYNLNTKYILETGIGYAQKGYKINEEILIDPCFSPITCGHKSELYHYKYDYLSIPIHLIYIIPNKINFSISTGMSLLIQISSNVDWILRKEFGNNSGQRIVTMENISNLNYLNITFDLGLGLGYRISEKFNAVIQPKLNYHLLSYENTDIRDKLYNINLFRNEDKSTMEHLTSYGIGLKLIYDL